MAKRSFADSRSCWKTAKHPEKPLEKCVSKVSLCDPEEVQRNQKVPGNDCSTRRSHKYMGNNCNPELFSVFPCWNTSKNQLRPTPAAEQPDSFVLKPLAPTRFRLLNLCAAPAKNIPRSSRVDISDLLFNTWKQTDAVGERSPGVSIQMCSRQKRGGSISQLSSNAPQKNIKVPRTSRMLGGAFNYDVGRLNTYRIRSGSNGLLLLPRLRLVLWEQTNWAELKHPRRRPAPGLLPTHLGLLCYSTHANKALFELY